MDIGISNDELMAVIGRLYIENLLLRQKLAEQMAEKV